VSTREVKDGDGGWVNPWGSLKYCEARGSSPPGGFALEWTDINPGDWTRLGGERYEFRVREPVIEEQPRFAKKVYHSFRLGDVDREGSIIYQTADPPPKRIGLGMVIGYSIAVASHGPPEKCIRETQEVQIDRL
jgi:hypothetical protein